ncbi:MAG TPA: vitamin K epoxide reductase family protein [Chloroflexota bacterium]
MDRILAALLGTYGFRLSQRSTQTIKRLHEEAREGNTEAQGHFTQTRYARALGPRNSDLGMIFYAALTVAAITGLIRRPLVWRALLTGSTLSVGVSIYLLWALSARLRVLCPICLQGHAANLATFTLLWRMRRSLR